MKSLRSEIQEHRVNAVEGNPRTVDPNQKGRQNATRFCKYCRTNGHTPSWCRKNIRDEGLKRIEKKELPRKKLPLLRLATKNDNQIMDEKNGLGSKIYNEESRITIMIGLQENFHHFIRISLENQTSHIWE